MEIRKRVNLEMLKARYNWRPIKDCPGRYVLANGVVDITPSQLCGEEIEVEQCRFPNAADIVSYCFFAGGGLISFHKPGGFLHTLGDSSGMQRKLEMLGSPSSKTAINRESKSRES